MKIQPIITVILILVLLTSCAPAETPAVPTLAPSATATAAPTLTSTPQPVTTIQGRTILSDFPGNNYCLSQERIPEGTPVVVTGIYKDYAAIEFQTGNQQRNAYVPIAHLETVPTNVPELGVEKIPWNSLVDYRPWPYYSNEVNGLVVTPESEEQSDWASDPTQHAVPEPLRIHFGIKRNFSSWAGVKLTGTEENITNNWWESINRMDISTDRTSYGLCVRDGTTEDCTANIPLPIPSDQEITLLFLDRNGKRLQVLNEDNTVVTEVDLTSLPGLHLPNGLFPFGWFRFGTTVGSPETLTLTNLSITTPPDGIYQPSWIEQPGLAEMAAPHNILIGTEFNPEYMLDQRSCEVMQHDFNLGALSVFTDAQVWLGPGEYNFEILDGIVNKSSDMGLTLYASHLVWGSYDKGVLPEWLKKGNYSQDELLTILHDHITTLVSRYKDKVKIWSIANEAPERDRYRGADFWYDHIGPQYIEKSFQWAREADSNAILILNAANNESPRDAETTYNINTLYKMVKTLKENGVPVDAVGMQMHLFLPWLSQRMPEEADIEATMKKFGELGVQVMITEMDVNLHEIPGTPEEKVEIQKKLYADAMTACINSQVCTLFATWGISDLNSWISSKDSQWVYKTHTPDAAPLLFDAEYQPKPAYYSVMDVLKKK
ncbi:MAG: endo-1,4-beta-xylanase [Anaerolineales bacterium]